MDTGFIGTKLTDAAAGREPMTSAAEDAYYRCHEGGQFDGLPRVLEVASGVIARLWRSAISEGRRIVPRQNRQNSGSSTT